MTGMGANWLAGVLLVQTRGPAPAAPGRSTATDLYLYLGLLIVAILALAVAVFVMKRWYERSRNDDEDASEFLTEAREMQEEGELTREEYLKIKAKLAAGLQGPKTVPAKGGDPAKRHNPLRRQNPPEP